MLVITELGRGSYVPKMSNMTTGMTGEYLVGLFFQMCVNRSLSAHEFFCFLNTLFTYSGTQRAAVKSKNFSRTVFTAYLPVGLFKNPENMLPFDRLQRF